MVRRARLDGRAVVLVTAAPERVAWDIAHQLGGFCILFQPGRPNAEAPMNDGEDVRAAGAVQSPECNGAQALAGLWNVNATHLPDGG